MSSESALLTPYKGLFAMHYVDTKKKKLFTTQAWYQALLSRYLSGQFGVLGIQADRRHYWQIVADQGPTAL